MATVQESIDNLRAQVGNISGKVDSAVALIVELAALIRAAADDPEEIQALADQLEAQATALGNAVVSNDPTPETP